MKKIIFIASFISVFLTGCAVQKDKTQFNGLGLTYTSNITQDQNGNHVSTVEASAHSGREKGAEGAALKHALDYCQNQNKNLNVLNTKVNSHLLVNGVAKITFKCI